MSPPLHAIASRERIDRYLLTAPAHIRPILLGMRDHGIGWATIPQRSGPFDVPSDRPTVMIIGDDLLTSLGPAGFHRKSVRRAIRRCRLVSIVACEALPLLYAAAASIAVALGRDAAVIETRPEHEMLWVDLVKREAPDAQLMIGSVKERGH